MTRLLCVVFALVGCAKKAPEPPAPAPAPVDVAPVPPPAPVVAPTPPPPPEPAGPPALCDDFYDGWTTVQLLDDRLRIDVPGRQDAPDIFERSITAERVDLEIGTSSRRQLGVLAKIQEDNWQGAGWSTLRSRMQERVVYGRVEEATLPGGVQAVLGRRSVTESRGSAIFVTVLHDDGSMTDVSLTVRADDHEVCDTLINKMYRTLRLGESG